MTIDASLDTLILPALPTYQNEFGTKKQEGGLTTAECVDGVMVWGRRQRPFPVTEDSETSTVEANCTFEVLTAGVELIIADASFSGCEVKVINASDGEITVKGGASGLNGSADAITIPARAMVFLTFFEGWITSNSTYSGSDEVSDFEKRIFLASHPVTTLYWTSDPRNPGDVYGGTWKQIKDRFILAAGDAYENGGTGGRATVILTVEQIPTHKHSFTPSGSVSSSFTGSSVSTDEKGGHTHKTNSLKNKHGTANIRDTEGMSGDNYAQFNKFTPSDWGANGRASISTSSGSGFYNTGANGDGRWTRIDLGHNHNMEHTHTTDSQGSHTHSVTTAGSVSSSFTGTTSNTGNAGGSSGTTQAHDNMPPYVVKYCWERTA